MGRIEVDPVELQVLSRRLATVARGLHGTGHRLRLGQAATGSQMVSEALGHFAERWDCSLQEVSESAATTAIDLRTAGDGYAQVEDAIADGFDGDR